MKTLFLILLLLLASSFVACHESKESGKAENSSKGDKTTEESDGLKLDKASQERAGLQFQTVVARSIHGTLYAAGRVAINEERTSHIGVVTDGRITELTARVGDTVRLGQTLGRFHSHDVHEAVAAFQTAISDSRRRQNALAYAQVQRDRYHRLYEIKSASRQEAEQSDANLASAESDLQDARIQVEKERVHLTEFLRINVSADGHVDEANETVPITSPISGVVVARPITLGAVVPAGTEAYTVADLSTVWVLASVNETDTGKLRLGLPALIKVDAFSKIAFKGTLTYVGKELDPTTRTLQARVLVKNAGQRLRPEMYASIEFPEPQTRQALFLPEEALQDLNGNTVVFVRKDNEHFDARPVSAGERSAGQVEIRAGLKAGEEAVVKGGFQLKAQMLRGTLEGG